jgi:hypothetical protein
VKIGTGTKTFSEEIGMVSGNWKVFDLAKELKAFHILFVKIETNSDSCNSSFKILLLLSLVFNGSCGEVY